MARQDTLDYTARLAKAHLLWAVRMLSEIAPRATHRKDWGWDRLWLAGILLCHLTLMLQGRFCWGRANPKLQNLIWHNTVSPQRISFKWLSLGTMFPYLTTMTSRWNWAIIASALIYTPSTTRTFIRLPTTQYILLLLGRIRGNYNYCYVLQFIK